ncbi:hypothetical protein C477_05154 [Haloterrigena salina JCM 13891]|uniref:Uncharacterized protein n=1 Tax=Haloterrigena salina JCM 13891 TaxID=1227488 RepID=M0CGE4_9EURY|nr:hypothetical protein [Haloterrigena salina]ELZ21703.1 hypothetical protein C477_05154 [Haloterrigena salina JCM 13891]
MTSKDTIEIAYSRPEGDDRILTDEEALSLSVGVTITVNGESFPGDGGRIGFRLRELIMGFVFFGMDDFIVGESERAIVTAGESYLVFERENEDHVRITLCYTEKTAKNPDDRYDAEPTIVVDRDPLVEEILQTIDELVEILLTENQNLHDRYRTTVQSCSEQLEEIGDAIE